MNLKAEAAFTSVTDEKTKAVSLDGGLEISGEIIPDTPLQHELLVALLGGKAATCQVTFAIEPVTEKVTFSVRAAKDNGIVAAAHARLQDRQEAEAAGKPLHIHMEDKAAEAGAKAKAEAEAKKAPLVSEEELAAARDAGKKKALLAKAEADGAAEVAGKPAKS